MTPAADDAREDGAAHGGDDLFLRLTPERVLAAVEAGGLATRPVSYPLNSFENRVYEVELEDRSRVIAKFYRPRRWSEAQILEEHEFLRELQEEEVPVAAPREFPGGGTLRRLAPPDGAAADPGSAAPAPIHYALFDRKGGRAPDELDAGAARRLGLLVGRVHAVGARHAAPHRLELRSEPYARVELAHLAARRLVPETLWPRYRQAAEALFDLYDERLDAHGGPSRFHRLHGDLHLGNVLLRDGELRLLDFDDMVTGPPVQDLWLALPGRGAEVETLRDELLDGYTRFRDFDRATLDLVEPLRGLRVVRYAAWLARRWHDPIFPRSWPHFGSDQAWREETEDLESILAAARGERRRLVDLGAGSARPGGEATPEDATELSNKDYFWDWEG